MRVQYNKKISIEFFCKSFDRSQDPLRKDPFMEHSTRKLLRDDRGATPDSMSHHHKEREGGIGNRKIGLHCKLVEEFIEARSLLKGHFCVFNDSASLL